MKKALVLAGGAAKGAYHVGALKALQEIGASFDIVTGTSIGALVGCMVAQNQIDELIELWENLTVTDVITDGVSIQIDMDEMFSKRHDLLKFLKRTWNDRKVNIDPFIEMIQRCLDYDKLMQSNTDFGLVTYQSSTNKPMFITKNEMSRENCANYLLASASCYPAFPALTFDGEEYIDGGYVDNCPIELAFKMGADEVVVIELTEHHTHLEYADRPNITFIRPTHSLGSFFDFERETLNRRISQGYYDALKTLKLKEGVNNTFELNCLDHDLIEQYYQKLLELETNYNRSQVKRTLNIFTGQPCSTALKNYRRHEIFDKSLYATTALDFVSLKICGRTYDELLDATKVIEQSIEYYQRHIEAIDLIITELKQMKISALRNMSGKINDKELICIFIRLISERNEDRIINLMMPIFPLEIAAACFLACCIDAKEL